MTARLGLIVNPIAGLGGRVGLKGTDGTGMPERALMLGGRPEASAKAARALAAFVGQDVDIVTGGGALGESACRMAGIRPTVIALAPQTADAADTERVLRAIRSAGAELVLFAGGDGTARIVAAGSGDMPILGIPAGVKMYSGVFALSPAAAGRIAADHLARPPAKRRCQDADILDLDEAALRHGFAGPRLFATARVPAADLVQGAKSAPVYDPDRDLANLAGVVAVESGRDDLVIVGPGTTAAAALSAMKLEGTLLGVDAISNGRIVARDASEADLFKLVRGSRSPRIVVGVLGGLGAVFGRGNQQIGPRILGAVGRARITVVASAAKLAGLPHLFVDTGDETLDADLSGYWRVRTAPRRDVVMRVVSGSA